MLNSPHGHIVPKGNGSVTVGGNAIGVRPSSGAAMFERELVPMKSDASEHPVLAAPEDGRTPPRRSPAVTDPLPSKSGSLTAASPKSYVEAPSPAPPGPF